MIHPISFLRRISIFLEPWRGRRTEVRGTEVNWDVPTSCPAPPSFPGQFRAREYPYQSAVSHRLLVAATKNVTVPPIPRRSLFLETGRICTSSVYRSQLTSTCEAQDHQQYAALFKASDAAVARHTPLRHLLPCCRAASYRRMAAHARSESHLR